MTLLTSTCDWFSLSMLVTVPLPTNHHPSSSPPSRIMTQPWTSKSQLHTQTLWGCVYSCIMIFSLAVVFLFKEVLFVHILFSQPVAGFHGLLCFLLALSALFFWPSKAEKKIKDLQNVRMTLWLSFHCCLQWGAVDAEVKPPLLKTLSYQWF